MALHAAVNSALRDRISGLVLDSPVLDWRTTLRALAAARGVPAALLPLAVRAAQGQTGLHGAPLLDTSVPTALHVPTLVVHGPDDTVAPWQPSRELAARRPTWSPCTRTAGPARGDVERRPGRLRGGAPALPHAPDVS